jgi:hypothetical protein
MPALLTAHDRAVNSLKRQIEQAEAWLRVDINDRRAAAFHHAKIAQLRAELNRLEETAP